MKSTRRLWIVHENSLMELSIEDKKTSETPFYLHFEAREPKTARNNIQAFFDFLEIRTLPRSTLTYTRPRTVSP